MPKRNTPAKPKYSGLTPIHMKMSDEMLKQIEAEMRRTGLTRSALLKLAWSEYMQRKRA